MINVREIKTKVCGITNTEDMLKAVYYGAWAVGFIFHKKSPRYVSPSKVRKLVQELPPFVTPIGVFVDVKEGAVKDICKFTGINTVQFHGLETASYCKRFKGYKIIKAFRVNSEFDFRLLDVYKVDAFLFDSFTEGIEGGTGQTFDWNLLKGKKIDTPLILSGGLNEENLNQALELVQPFAVDVSSGVEKAPGIKDPRKIRGFMDTVNFINHKS